MTDTLPTSVPFAVRNDHVPDLPPVDVPGLDIGTASGTSEPTGDQMPAPAPASTISEGAMRNVLSLLFKVGFLYYGDGHEHWIEGTDEDIEMMLQPGIKWVSRLGPGAVAAVERMDMESFPVLLLYSWGKRWLTSRKIEAEKKKRRGPAGQSVAETDIGEGTTGGYGRGFNTPIEFAGR